MKVATAEIDRGDSRAMPQTPWPEVQPDPKVTPIPTMKPPTISMGVETGTSTAGICPMRMK